MTESYFGALTAVLTPSNPNCKNQGWTGKLFFSRGGAGSGKAKNLRGGEPPPPHSSGRGGEGVKIYGAGNILRVLIEIICCSKEISICIALSEVNLLNIHNLDRNHN